MLKVETFTFGMFQVHNYLLYDTETKEAVLFDTGKDPHEVLKTVEDKGLDLKLLLYTHTHIDHVEGHWMIRNIYPDLPALMHAEEQRWLNALPVQAQMFNIEIPEAPRITGFVQPDQVITFSNFSIEVRFSPGHSSGGICYYVKEGPFLFTGDTIFAGTIGRTDIPGGDFDTLMESINRQVLTLPDETSIYPGHGALTTVGEEKRHNPFVLQYGSSGKTFPEEAI